MRIPLAALVLVLTPTIAHAQGVSLPATCTTGDRFQYTAVTPPFDVTCVAPNFWQPTTLLNTPDSLTDTTINNATSEKHGLLVKLSGSASDVLHGDGTWGPAAGGGVPAGLITVIVAGTCPTGWTEVAALNGKMLRGTVAANGDVGATGGSDTITPTVATLTAAAQTFTGSSATSSAVSGGTPAGTNGTGTVTATGTIAWPAGVPTFAGAQLATHLHGFGTIAVASHTVVATKQGSSAGNVVTTATHAVSGSTAAITAGTPAGTVAWPAGVPTFAGSSAVTSAEIFTGNLLATHQHTVTATGTNGTSAVTGTLTAFDNRPAYVNVIFCAKS